jgi:hypothetical protein
MDDRTALATVHRLRTFLYLLAAVLFTGTIGELLMVGHDESRMQLVPFGLCLLGLVALGVAWRRPDRQQRRAAMVTIAAGSVLGVWEHLEGNIGFVHEVRPHAGTLEAFREGLGGAAPLLAPGILAIGAAVAIAATFATAERPRARSASRRMTLVTSPGGRRRSA